MVLCHGMTSRVALVMAPLLPRICTGVGNMGLENGGGVQGGFKGGSRGGLSNFVVSSQTNLINFG